MQIPQDLQRFEHSTLVVVGDFEHAKLYRAQGDTIDEIKAVQSPEPHLPDTEGMVEVGGDRFGSISNDVDEGARRIPYAKALAHEINGLLSDGQAKYVCLVMPSEMCRRIKEELPQDKLANLTKVVEQDLVFEPLTEILKRLG